MNKYVILYAKYPTYRKVYRLEVLASSKHEARQLLYRQIPSRSRVQILACTIIGDNKK